jgi:hypothetical protein
MAEGASVLVWTGNLVTLKRKQSGEVSVISNGAFDL